MKISVIMPSFLGQYDGCAKDRKIKMARAIQSFLKQHYEEKELIIVADGCQDTIDFIKNNYADEPSIKSFIIEKQKNFSGLVRQKGLTCATGDIICYLDNDDMFKEKNHLSTIFTGFSTPKTSWIYYNDFVKFLADDTKPVAERNAVINYGQIGISNIAHKNYTNISWANCDGYGHDFLFIKQLEFNYPTFKKITGPSYLVCHIPNMVDN